MYIGFFLVSIFAFAVSAAYGNIEVSALHELRTSVDDPYNALVSWDVTMPNPCTWYHITCNSNKHVVRVDLGNAGLSGTLRPSLRNLTNLQYLELFGNNFTGVIPGEIGDMTRLVSLDLYNNQLSGSIPETLGNLKSLRFLRLNANALSGEIPGKLLELIRWGHLKVLCCGCLEVTTTWRWCYFGFQSGGVLVWVHSRGAFLMLTARF